MSFIHFTKRVFMPLALVLGLITSMSILPGGPLPIMAEPSNSPIQGIMDYQVFPRKGMTAAIPFTTTLSGTLKAEVVNAADGRIVVSQTYPLSAPGTSEGRALTIANVPVGGEYTLRFTSPQGTTTFEHILVGEIWVVGGQSNAVGMAHAADEPSPTVHYYRENRWQEGRDPLFVMLLDSNVYVNAWLRAAQHYYDLTGIPVGIMGWAYGGVPMSRFWDAGIKEMPDFKDLVTQHGRGASAFLWYQGESDANLKGVPVYKDRLHSMASTIRRYADNPELLMVVVQLSYFAALPNDVTPHFGRLRETQRAFCAEDPRAVLIPALPYSHGDPIHLDYDGHGALARRIGDCLTEIHKTGVVRWQGPRAVSARFASAERTTVRVDFDSARELRLLEQPPGVPPSDSPRSPTLDWFIVDKDHQGFAEITRSEIRDGRLVVDIAGASLEKSGSQIDDQSVGVALARTGYIQPSRIRVEGLSLVIELPVAAQPGATISYGLMNNSLCSLVDEEDRPAATFADMPIQDPPGAARTAKP